MPTAGEARLLASKKSINERSTTRKPLKKAGTSVSTLSKVKKSSQSKTQNTRIVIKKNGKENVEPKMHGAKAKPAPDFSKLHNKWNSKFQKGKAVTKKPNTKVSPFVLTEVQTYTPLSNKNSDSSDKENAEEENLGDDFVFEIDDNALQGILNNTGIQVQQEVHPQTRYTYAGPQKSEPNTISGVSAKRTSIYYTGSKKTPTTNQQPLKTRPVYGFEARLGKKQVVWADKDDGNDDEISFKPDASALESILNNKGIDIQQTLGVRHTMASTRSVSFLQNSKRQSFLDSQSKRTSIYYTGSKSKSISSEAPRPSLIGKPRTSVIEKPTVPFSQRTATTPTLKHQYEPGSTVVGKQDEQMEGNGFETHTFAKPFMPSHQETSSQVSKTTDIKPCITNSLMTPCRGKLDTRPQAPSTSSKKQVSWSDVLTPHRGMDKVKAKEVILTASKERTDLVDSSPWMKGASNVYPPKREESPVDDGTVALRLFSDDDTQQKADEKKEVELEELERQAIEELQLLEVEEKPGVKESYNGSNNTRAKPLSDISGCEPLTTPQQISNTPRMNLTDQWINATPQNHLRVTIRNKTPIASPLVRHLRSPGLLNPRCRTVSMASPRPLVNQPSGFQVPNATRFVSQSGPSMIGGSRQQRQQQQQLLPVESGIEASTGCAAQKPTPFVSQTRQGLISMTHPMESVQGRPNPFVSQTSQSMAGEALPTNRPEPFTPMQQVVQTPVMNVPLDNGQPCFGLLSSIKKSSSGVGNKRPHSVISNPSFHKSVAWNDNFYASTPGIEGAPSPFQGHSATSNGYPNYTSLPTNSFPTNVPQPHNSTTRQRPILHDNYSYKPREFPSSSVLNNGFNEPSGNLLTRNFHHPAEQSFVRSHANTFEKPAETPWSSLHGNNFSKPAEKPLSTLHGINYMPAEKPLVSIHGNSERSLYGESTSNRMPLGVSGNDNVQSDRVSGLSWDGGHDYRACTSVAPLFATATVARTGLVQSNGQTGTNSTYTNSSTMGKGTVVSIHSPAFICQSPHTNFSTNSDHLCKRPGVPNVAFENRNTMMDTVRAPRTSGFHPNNSDSLSLRSAVEPLGFQRREPVVDKRAVTILTRTTTEENCALSQGKRLDARLPRSLETRTSLAEEALLDTEVALYTTLGARIKKRCTRDLTNPLAKTFEEGDAQHIVPICVCNDKIYCSVHPVFQSPTLVRRENLK